MFSYINSIVFLLAFCSGNTEILELPANNPIPNIDAPNKEVDNIARIAKNAVNKLVLNKLNVKINGLQDKQGGVDLPEFLSEPEIGIDIPPPLPEDSNETNDEAAKNKAVQNEYVDIDQILKEVANLEASALNIEADLHRQESNDDVEVGDNEANDHYHHLRDNVKNNKNEQS